MIYTHAAVALLAGAIAATGAWQVQAWRWGAHEADRLQAEQTARDARESSASTSCRISASSSLRTSASMARANATGLNPV